MGNRPLGMPQGFFINDNLPSSAVYYRNFNQNSGWAPYTSVADAKSQVVSGLRYKGLTVNINGNEYWWKDGVLDADLVLKVLSPAGGDAIVEKTRTQLQALETAVAFDPNVFYLCTDADTDSRRLLLTALDATSLNPAATDVLTGIVGTWVLATDVFTSLSASGTVTSVSATDGNGFDFTVANPSTTPAISLAVSPSGVLKGSAGALAAALSADVISTLGFTPEDVANKVTGFGTLNNTLYPTTQAVATYVASLVAGLLDLRGGYDASSNLFPATGGSGAAGAILKGDFWYITVAGTLGGTPVVPTQGIFANVDTPGQTAGNWEILPVGSAPVWGTITGTLSAQTDLQTALNGKVATAISINKTDLITLRNAAGMSPGQLFLVTNGDRSPFVTAYQNNALVEGAVTGDGTVTFGKYDLDSDTFTPYAPGVQSVSGPAVDNTDPANPVVITDYETLSLATWTTRVGASGLIPGYFYLVTAAYHSALYDVDWDVLVLANSVNTIQDEAGIRDDSVGGYNNFIDCLTDASFSVVYLVETSTALALTPNQVLAYNGEYAPGAIIYAKPTTPADSYIQLQIDGEDRTDILLKNAKFLGGGGVDYDGLFGTYTPQTVPDAGDDYFTPNVVPDISSGFYDPSGDFTSTNGSATINGSGGNFQYWRIGDIGYVTGAVDVTFDALATDYSLEFNLPIAPDNAFAATGDFAGTINQSNDTLSATTRQRITANVAGATVLIEVFTVTTPGGPLTISFNGSYNIAN